jgi:hypothetical protein
MALLGQDGRLTLLREAPDPLTLGPETLHQRTNSLRVGSDAFWSGDEVVLFNEDGLPLYDNPQGTAQYVGGFRWKVGQSRQHIADDTDKFYRQDDTAYFYEQVTGKLIVQRTVFLHVDQLGRYSFYLSQRDALIGNPVNRLPIEPYDWGRMLLFARGTKEYANAVIRNYAWGDCSGCLGDVCAPHWEFVCDLQEWSFDTDAAAIDTTPVGVKFGEAVKSLVTATGTLNFYVDRRAIDWDSSDLLKLVLLTQRGCKAHAEFWVSMQRDGDMCKGILPGDFYYEADILMVRSGVSVRAVDYTTGTINFATTGEIALRTGYS